MWLVDVLLFILVLAAVVLYLGCAVAAAMVAAAFAVAAYGLGVPAAYLTALTEVLATRSTGSSGPARWPKRAEGADPAVLQYFYGPAMAEARHSLSAAHSHGLDLWRRGTQAVSRAMRSDMLVATVPLGIGGGAGMAVGTAVGTVIATGCAIAHLLVIAACTAVVRAIGGVLRAADSALLRIKNIRIVCPHCGDRVPYPGYLCPGEQCERRHWDVRPGRYGVIWRYCQCGTRMKTLLLLGSAHMVAFCPSCGDSLDHRPGDVPETVVAFLGAQGAGKTSLASAMIAQLMIWARAGHLGIPTDQQTPASADAAGKSRGSDHAELASHRSLVLRITSGRITRILHMFDPPGKFFDHAERTAELRYLREARTFVLVIDPLTVDASWTDRPNGETAESSRQSADRAYHLTYQQIEAMGVELSEARLAVAFSHADMVQVPDYGVEEWARRDLGLSNLVISASQNFKATGYFLTAAGPSPDGTVDPSITALLAWVLAASGLTLPGGDDGRLS